MYVRGIYSMCIYTDIHILDLFMYYGYINVFIYLCCIFLSFCVCVCGYGCVYVRERTRAKAIQSSLKLIYISIKNLITVLFVPLPHTASLWLSCFWFRGWIQTLNKPYLGRFNDLKMGFMLWITTPIWP